MNFARLGFPLSGFFVSPQKFFQIFLCSLCQNRVLGVSSYRGAKSITSRARSPPFLGSQEKSRPRKTAGNQNAVCPRGQEFSEGAKNFLNFFCSDFAKIAFSG
jgi:hypothetical protein